jgi:hypothetical protein
MEIERGEPGPDRGRIAVRGATHLEAKAAGLVEKLPPLLVATPQAIALAEVALRYSLPTLLRRLYLEVGNGGFGPGYGVLGLQGGHLDDKALFRQGLTFAGLLERWIAGRLYQPAVIQDPTTGGWRAASDEEMAEWMAE